MMPTTTTETRVIRASAVRSFLVEPIARDVYAILGGEHPNACFIVSDEGVLVIDARPTVQDTKELRDAIRGVTEAPITHLVWTHGHRANSAVARTLGAPVIISQRRCRAFIEERGDAPGEIERLLDGVVESREAHALLPNLAFDRELDLYWGGRQVLIANYGRGHTAGDLIIHIPSERLLITGDLVQNNVTPFAGDGYLEQWTQTLTRLSKLSAAIALPGRGGLLEGEEVGKALRETSEYLGVLRHAVSEVVEREGTLADAVQFAHQMLVPQFGHWDRFHRQLAYNVGRAYEEVSGSHPRKWSESRRWHLMEELGADDVHRD